MNILKAFVLFAILLKCVAASGGALEVMFKEAVERGDFEWLNEHMESWYKRNDLLDDVIANGADAIVKLIQVVGRAKRHVVAALFDQGEAMIDGVFGESNTMTMICMI